MRKLDFLMLIVLSAIWGASFLFMRVASPSFGAIPLILVRVGVALICLLPILLRKSEWRIVFGLKKHFLMLGVFNFALPFCLLTYATLSIEAGFTSVLNATTPLFASIVGAVWMRTKLRVGQWLGVALGICGVAVLSWEEFSFTSGGNGWSVIAGLAAGLSYGFAANYAKLYMSKVHPFTVAAGTTLAATIVLLPLGIYLWPSTQPTLLPWLNALGLAIFCTAFAVLIYFHLIKSAGAVQASTVTFIIPIFAIVWGAFFLDEAITVRIVAGTAITLIGTAFTLGLITFGTSKPRGEADA